MRLMSCAVSLLAVGILHAALSIASFAQTETATLNGVVTDPKGGVVPDVEVIATRIESGAVVTTRTNGAGIYSFTGLMPGHYRLIVRKEGFKEIAIKGFELFVQDKLEQNFSLEIGSVSETVTVRGAAPLIDTQDAAVSTVIGRNLVENLPLNGRSIQTLIDLTPGVVLTPAAFGTPGQFSINGQRSDANYFTIDGVSANIGASPGAPLVQYGGGVYPGLSSAGGTNNLVSVDALQEFRVQTSTFAPEYGRTPGGQIALTTRSGENQFHGTLFEYLRNDVLDANDWFTDKLGLAKPALRQNDFGGVFSGPLVKNQAFFFFSYEGLRLRLPQTRTTEVPSLATRSSATPDMQAILNAFPLPTAADLGNGLAPFTGSFSNPSTLDAASLRLDYSPFKRWTVFARYNFSPSDTATRGSTTPGQDNLSLSTSTKLESTTQTLTLGASTTISSAAANEFRFNASHIRVNSLFELDTFGGAVPIDPAVVFPAGFTFANGTLDMAIFTPPFPILGSGPISRNKQRQLNFVDNVTWTVGPHLLKFGVDYRRLSPVQNPLTYLQAAFFQDAPSASAGNPFLFEVNAAQTNVNFIFTNVSLFAQDSWRVTRRLNLTYGVRWDINPVPGQGDGTPEPRTLAGLNTSNGVDPSTLTSFAPPGTPLYETSFHDFAPRVGVAYQFRNSGDWTTVVRGGFGVFRDISSSVVGGAADGFPYHSASFLPGPFPAPSDAVPPPVGETSFPIASITVPDPELESPYSLQWNVAVEQQLGPSQSVAATYAAAVGRRLLYQRQFGSANENFNTINLFLNGATSDYNSLQLQFKRRLSNGLQGLASYTWAHAIDMDSSAVDIAGLSRGPANFDVRHTFAAAASYEVPQLHLRTVPSAILNNWMVELPVHAQSSSPVDLVAGFIVLPGGEFFQTRPDVVPGQSFYVSDSTAPGGRRINSNAFAPPPADASTGASLRQGDLGRNALRGLNFWQVDLAFQRNFHLRERIALQFRTEFFNIFNHPNFGPPVRTLGDPNFGTPANTFAQSLGSGGADEGFNPLYQLGGPRSIQFALKLQF